MPPLVETTLGRSSKATAGSVAGRAIILPPPCSNIASCHHHPPPVCPRPQWANFFTILASCPVALSLTAPIAMANYWTGRCWRFFASLDRRSCAVASRAMAHRERADQCVFLPDARNGMLVLVRLPS